MIENDLATYKLTQYSHGAGCGCKIAPEVLDSILKTNLAAPDNNKLLVGNSSKDDAAVYDLGNGTALVTTTDFFMPIVDDPFSFGRIAGANAISDVYAMGGQPIVAIAILGWPVDKLPAAIAQQVIEGARSICAEAGISLAGGHSIDSPEPIFGLAVNGLVAITNLKRNSSALLGDVLFLTKPIGIGILSTAQKRDLLSEPHLAIMMNQLMQLNKIGQELGYISGVHAMTDVTGFGLLGHLVEMCEGSNLSANLFYNKVPVLPAAKSYLEQRVIPGGSIRNWKSYGHKIDLHISLNQHEAIDLLPDPQTNGGLLIAVKKDDASLVSNLLEANGLHHHTIGELTGLKEKAVYVN
ncbi:MAG: selenide, water dikinase SelD [Bacteroidota bacterium]